MKLFRSGNESGNQRGATLVLIAICMFVFIAFAALAIDIGHLVVTRNELQNAADAGALAGALALYLPGSRQVNEGANIEARNAATANKSEKVAVEVSESVDVQRGHWNNTAREFTANDAIEFPAITGPIDEIDIDNDTRFVNAVRVTAHRNNTPVTSFFARIFGFDSFTQRATAIAYCGPAGTLKPLEADFPIVICAQAIRGWGYSSKYDCSIGRMINSGGSDDTHNTGGWTDFNQVNPCQGGTNASTMKQLATQACAGQGLNPEPVVSGLDIATNGGEIQNVLDKLAACFRGRTVPWRITVPVVDCDQNNITKCETVVGAITLDILAINDENQDKDYSNVPALMDGWTNTGAAGTVAAWEAFKAHFNLPSEYLGKTIYFRPNCEGQYAGVTGGKFFGVFARIPVLVE